MILTFNGVSPRGPPALFANEDGHYFLCVKTAGPCCQITWIISSDTRAQKQFHPENVAQKKIFSQLMNEKFGNRARATVREFVITVKSWRVRL